jgi:hypothetical protein
MCSWTRSVYNMHLTRQSYSFDIYLLSIKSRFLLNFSTSRHKNNINIKEISTRHLNILSWLYINKNTICSMKTLRCIILTLEVLVCLVGYLVQLKNWHATNANNNYCMGCRLQNNSGQEYFPLFFLGQHLQKKKPILQVCGPYSNCRTLVILHNFWVQILVIFWEGGLAILALIHFWLLSTFSSIFIGVHRIFFP